jgi:hypothetical protein
MTPELGSLETVPENEKRGRGRPPLNPEGGDTVPLRIRLSNENLAEVGRLIAEGKGKNASEALRALLDESAERRRKK